MKILRIASEWPPPWEGLDPLPYELTTAQVKLGHTFDVFVAKGSSVSVQGVDVNTFMAGVLDTIPTTLLNTALFLLTPNILTKYFSILRRSEPPIDLIHCHGHYGAWLYWYRKQLSRFRPKAPGLRIPIVASFRDTVAGQQAAQERLNVENNFLEARLDVPLALYADKLAFEVADALVFSSEEAREEAIEHYAAEPEKCFVLENGVNSELFIPRGSVEREKIQKDLGLEPFDKLIMVIGNHEKRYNTAVLVQALKFLPEKYKLLVVGTFVAPDYRSELDTLIKQSNLEDRVLFTSFPLYPDAPIIYQGSDLTVLPSSLKNMSHYVVESISCAVPVLGDDIEIANDVPGIYNILSMQPQDLAKQIYQIVEPTVFVDRNVLVGRYSWTTRATELEKIYSTAIANRARALEKVLGRNE